jgi:hypothetical protein
MLLQNAEFAGRPRLNGSLRFLLKSTAATQRHAIVTALGPKACVHSLYRATKQRNLVSLDSCQLSTGTTIVAIVDNLGQSLL